MEESKKVGISAVLGVFAYLILADYIGEPRQPTYELTTRVLVTLAMLAMAAGSVTLKQINQLAYGAIELFLALVVAWRVQPYLEAQKEVMLTALIVGSLVYVMHRGLWNISKGWSDWHSDEVPTEAE